jgi:hypothetical protein
MNTLTSNNKDYFKSHLRFYADAIKSGQYIKSNIRLLDSLFITKSSGLTTDSRASVKIYSPSNSGIVTITSSLIGNEFIYFPVNTGQTINVGVGTTSYALTINQNSVTSGGETYYLNDSIPVSGNKFLTINAFGGLLLSGNDPPSYSVGISTTTVNEGSSVNFTVNTLNVGSGTTLYYSTGGSMEAADFSNNSLTGSFTIVGTGATTGVATVTRTISNDFNAEGSESFTFVVRTNSISGTVVATSSTITVADVVPSYSVTPSTLLVNEGYSVDFTVATTSVPDGTILYYTTTGGAAAADFTDASLTGSFTVNSNTATISRTLSSDRTTEGSDNFAIEIRRTSITGTIVATSNIVYINDTSLNVGQSSNGFTFGPVQVNRDGGNTALASDWYTICGIDNLPEGSKIALFIDNSGSMTTATIQASYNLLLSKLAAKNITIITLENGNEDWITPFLTDLS